MRLEFDVGNTRLKWRVINEAASFEERVVARGALGRAEFDERQQFFGALAHQLKSCDVVSLNEIRRVKVGSVAGDEFDRDFSVWCAEILSVTAEFAVVSASASGIGVGYDNPALLGVDRWLAVLAAAHIEGVSQAVVADCGSAITIDVLKGDQHLGGYIAPGLRLMRESLLGKTSRVGSAGGVESELVPGSSTSQAVGNGVALMAAAFVAQACQRFVGDGGRWLLLLTGGDAEVLQAHLGLDIEVRLLDELVLDGLEFAEFKVIES